MAIASSCPTTDSRAWPGRRLPRCEARRAGELRDGHILAYTRGAHLRNADFIDDPDKVPYELSVQERGKSVGQLLTDAIEQIVPGITNEGKPAEEGPAMLMASYGDGLEVDFWDGLRDKRSAVWGSGPAKGFTSNFDRYCSQPKGVDDVDERWTANAAPRPMVLEVQRQLQAMHGLSFTPHPICAAYHDWGADPYGGGWNSWNIGVRPQDLVDELIHPDARAPVFICGEAYSSFQGWVEGAIETADKVLALHGVDPLPRKVPATDARG